MANDGSMASLTEEYIAAKLRALDCFTAEQVAVFEGAETPTPEALFAQFKEHRDLWVTIMYAGDRPVVLEEGQVGYEAKFAVFVLVQNASPGVARHGDATFKGTNYYRDRLRKALNSGTTPPAITANDYAVDWMRWESSVDVLQERDCYLMRGMVVCRESPTS